MIPSSTAAGWVQVDLPGGSVVLTNAQGGDSMGTWASPQGGGGANMGDHVGDDPAAVAANRASLERLLPAGRTVAWMNQVHSAICAEVCAPSPRREAPAGEQGQLGEQGSGQAAGTSNPAVANQSGQVESGRQAATSASQNPSATDVPTADALLSTHPEQCPAVVVADCVPIGLLASDGSVAVAVHAGRAGLLAGVVTNAIAAARTKQRPGSFLQAVIGPHICAACYEVSPDLARQVEASHPHMVTTSRWGTPALDLRAAVVKELEGAGVQIAYQSHQCTLEDPAFYSYRRSGPTGRQALVVIAQHAEQNHGKIQADS